MSVTAAGALAAALVALCLVLAPFAGGIRAPQLTRHPDARALAAVGWKRQLWQWEAVRGASLLSAVLIASALPSMTVPAVCAAALAPSVVVRVRADTASRRARTAATRLLRAAEATLRAGGTLPEALRRAIEGCTDPLARAPFSAALRAFDLGAPFEHALHASAGAVTDRRVRIALETLALGANAHLPSSRCAVLIGAVADRLAFAERVDDEVAARTGGLRSQVLLLAAVVPVVATYLALTVPSLGATLNGPLGRTVLVPGAFALELIGIVASRRAMNGLSR